ncbi:hypothetical protein R3P38DRAFT_3509141 [Favolaschia claudopus]|uniref:Uncharacterized protein n=1 Tax=Favolaschia claudopus TaxID=2862362 RepID=A0AAV9Z2W0_9AGAR
MAWFWMRLTTCCLLTVVCAANDWSTPCFHGDCSYDIPSSSEVSGLLRVQSIINFEKWGAADAISDITPAAGWTILDCEKGALSQDVRLVCHDSSGCPHLAQSTGSVGKLVWVWEHAAVTYLSRWRPGRGAMGCARMNPLPHSVTASSNCADLESGLVINEKIKGGWVGEAERCEVGTFVSAESWHWTKEMMVVEERERSGSDRPLSAAVTKRHTVFPGSDSVGVGARRGDILEPLAPRAWGDGVREDEPKTETPRRGQPTRPRLTHKKRRLPNQAANFSSRANISFEFKSEFLVTCHDSPRESARVIAKIWFVNVAKSNMTVENEVGISLTLEWYNTEDRRIDAETRSREVIVMGCGVCSSSSQSTGARQWRKRCLKEKDKEFYGKYQQDRSGQWMWLQAQDYCA